MKPRDFRICGLLFLLPIAAYSLNLFKCCKLGEHKNLSGDCVPSHFPALHQNKTDNWPWWFPSLPIHSKTSNATSNVFPNDSKITIGVNAPCCDFDLVLAEQGVFRFFEDGSVQIFDKYLSHPDIQLGNITYPPNSFCIDRIYQPKVHDDYIIEHCPCKTTVCVRKCCESSFLLNLPGDENNISIEDCVYVESAKIKIGWMPKGLENYYVLRGFPECAINEEVIMQKVSLGTTSITPDGALMIAGNKKAEKGKFCAEIGKKDDHFDNYIMRCTQKPSKSLKKILYGALSVIGAFFLLLTIVIHAILPSQHSVHDKNLISQTWSLFIAYLGFVVANFAVNDMPHWLCITVGFVIQYASLASFFWLNVLCIDLTRAFTKLRLIRNAVTWQQQRRFMQYSLYAWLSPAVIVLATIVVDFTPNLPKNIIKPEFSTYCWFRSDSWAKFAYFYGPIAVLLAANIVLFLYTVYKIRAIQKKVSSLLQNSTTHEKKRTILYMKLFSLMGLSWIFELISWFVQGPDYYWYALDIINLFRAVFIFIVLCCKREILEGLREKYNFPKVRGRQTASPSVVTMISQLDQRNAQTPTTFEAWTTTAH